jgi:hypothetical protein
MPGQSPVRGDWEAAALQAGIHLTLPQRSEWDPVASAQQTWVVAATGPGGDVQALCTVRAHASRALPLHRVLRVERFRAPAGASTAAILWGVGRLAARIPRVIRAHVELFDVTGADLAMGAAAARAAGYERWNAPRIYARTVILDLRPEEDAIFGGLHATGRRHVRSVSRHAVDVRVLEAGFPEGVLEVLLQETLARTGGVPAVHAWAEILALSEARPDLSRVVGVFRRDRPGPEGLLSFAWGCHHGDHAHYATAASTRNTDLRIPMVYPLAWDLILWARRHGATWFDFGGISAGHAGSSDPLGGISDFKRRFTDRVVEVGEEWVVEPSPWRARAARWSSAVMQRALGRVAS